MSADLPPLDEDSMLPDILQGSLGLSEGDYFPSAGAAEHPPFRDADELTVFGDDDVMDVGLLEEDEEDGGDGALDMLAADIELEYAVDDNDAEAAADAAGCSSSSPDRSSRASLSQTSKEGRPRIVWSDAAKDAPVGRAPATVPFAVPVLAVLASRLGLRPDGMPEGQAAPGRRDPKSTALKHAAVTSVRARDGTRYMQVQCYRAAPAFASEKRFEEPPLVSAWQDTAAGPLTTAIPSAVPVRSLLAQLFPPLPPLTAVEGIAQLATYKAPHHRVTFGAGDTHHDLNGCCSVLPVVSGMSLPRTVVPADAPPLDMTSSGDPSPPLTKKCRLDGSTGTVPLDEIVV